MFNRALSAFVVVLLAWANPAQAGGYDTPILYTARHMGMGGTAISYVDEASALFHNPAGLGHTKIGSFSLALSPLTGKLQATPGSTVGKEGQPINIFSEPTVAPFFLGGATYRISKNITLGLAAYPVASAGAEYKYDTGDFGAPSYMSAETINKTKLVFIEVSPGIAYNLPGNIRLGAGYRVSIVTFEREKIENDISQLGLNLKGYNFEGFRLGAQWHKEFGGDSPLRRVDLGMTYRHKTKTTVSGDTANFLASLIEDDEGQKTIVPDAYKRTEMDFTLPSKLGVGMRLQFDENSFLAVDYEHGFNSQNEEAPVRFSKNSDDDVEGENQANDKDAELVSKFSWFDASTVRVGLEREIELSTANARSVKVRLGHIYDGQTANPKYPTPFGTPAAPTHTYTAGLGYETASYEMNFAYAFRSGAVTITPEDIEGNGCVTCGDEGKYELKLHGFYLDYTHYFN